MRILSFFFWVGNGSKNRSVGQWVDPRLRLPVSEAEFPTIAPKNGLRGPVGKSDPQKSSKKLNQQPQKSSKKLKKAQKSSKNLKKPQSQNPKMGRELFGPVQPSALLATRSSQTTLTLKPHPLVSSARNPAEREITSALFGDYRGIAAFPLQILLWFSFAFVPMFLWLHQCAPIQIF